MRELLSLLLVLGCLILIIRFILGGGRGRVGRPPAGVLTRYVSPTDSVVPAAALGGYAMGTAIVITDPHADEQTGILIGLLIAVFVAFPAAQRFTIPALGVVGAVCALIQMGNIMWGGEYDALKTAYRAALVLLVFTSFVAGTVIFDRASALKGERGLALLGVVDVVGFLVRPTGADLFDIDQVGHAAFLLCAGGIAFALGWAASEAVLGLVGIAVVGLTVLLNAPDGWLGVVAALSAAAFTAVGRGIAGATQR